MTIEKIRQLHRAQPFRSFEIHMADGRSLPVRHPEMLAINEPGRTVIIALDDGTFEVVDLLLVTSPRSHANGTSGKRGRR